MEDYKEKLRLAKEALDSGSYDKETIEYIFPELKESENEDVELTNFESALFSAFSDAWQEYLSGKEVNVAKWAKEHSAELLEVAREQKPAWSEDDENMLQKALSTIRYALSIPADKEDDPCFAGSSTISWLKSLKERCNWKPNEEQMKQLGWVAEQNKDNMIGKELMLLYQELKKLKE